MKLLFRMFLQLGNDGASSKCNVENLAELNNCLTDYMNQEFVPTISIGIKIINYYV